ncbi:MAG: GNAT family N-acetyltransferase [Rhizobiales bacterium]|nr:GNAT family N-acetyltransferase [Hyphomicrobiales bacterium]
MPAKGCCSSTRRRARACRRNSALPETEFVAPPFGRGLLEKLRALNNAHALELSYAAEPEFLALIAAASTVRAEASGLALLIAFDETCTYASPNFAWLKSKFPRFIYIDRIVVDEQARGMGLARKLYAELEIRAREQSRERLVCEINSVPPNPSSDAFHRALGFLPVGKQVLKGKGKTVRYWAKEFS